MSQKAGSIGSIVLGVAIVIAGFVTYGATWSALPAVIGGALTIAGGVVGLTFQAKALTPEASRSQDLQIANAGEGFPVAVIFGEQKVIPNFMNWTAENFRSVEGTVAVGGKGGGGTTQPNGIIDYYLSFELALCVGPIDEIGQVISVPGDAFCRGANYSAGNGVQASQSGVTVTFSTFLQIGSEFVGGQIVWADGTTDTVTAATGTGLRVSTSATKSSQRFQLFGRVEQIVFDDTQDYEELVLTGVNEGGFVRVYRGTSDQTRIEANDPYFDTGMNYRNVCWAIFSDFWINRGTPTPKTYQFILRRFPKCVRDDGSTVTEIETRGSIDPSHPSYYQANPAAVVYEIYTNKLWGQKCSSEIIDEDSFARVSRYFKTHNIGISFTLDGQEKVSSVMDGLRLQLKLVLTWKSGKLKLRCLMDEQDVAETIQTLTSNEVEDLRVVRPLWTSTVNEIRGEFNSRAKLYKPDSVHFQDAANIELTGRLNSTTTSLRAFTDWNTSFKQLVRNLMEASYPAAMATFYMNRFRSNVEVGDCVRLVWSEWGANAVTAYFVVNKIEPMGKNDDRLKFYATEDYALSPVEGIETNVDLPTQRAWQKVIDFTQGDITKTTQKTSQNGAINPILAVEMPAMFDSGAQSWLSIFGVKPSAGTLSASCYATPANSSTFYPFNGTFDFAVAITLTTPIVHTIQFDRTTSFFEFTAIQSEMTTLLAVSTASAEADNLEVVDSQERNFVILGDEIIKLGKIEHISGSLFRARNAVRGCYGSPVRVHATGTQGFFRETISKGFDVAQFGTSLEYILKFKAYPVTAAGVNQIGDEFYIYRGGEKNQYVMGNKIRPYPAEFIRATMVGNSLYLTCRYRSATTGAGSRPLLGQYNPTAGTMNGVITETRLNDFMRVSGYYLAFQTTLLSYTNNADGTVTLVIDSVSFQPNLGAPPWQFVAYTKGEPQNRESAYSSVIDVQ